MRNEIWSLIQRLVAFEEPVAKWVHFKNSISKLDKAMFVASDFESNRGTWALSLEKILRQAFDLSDNDIALGRSFAFAYAQEESARFTGIALQMWRHKFALDIVGRGGNASVDESLKSKWVETFALLGPIFAVTLKDGPWRDDERGRFIIDCLQDFKTLKASDAGMASSAGLGKRRSAEERLPANLLPNLIVLVEGATEAVLLPLLADCLQLDLQKERALLMPAGGANQVVKKYLYLKEVYSLPIFVVLDLDAEEQSDILASNLREIDRLHVLSDGEIEDVLRLDILVPMLNRYIAELPGIVNDSLPIKFEHFSVGVPRKQVLAKLWRERELGKFDKVGFAKFVAEDLPASKAGRKALSEDGLAMIESIREQTRATYSSHR